MSSSGGAPSAGASQRTAVFAGQGRSPDAPPPCTHCDHAPSDLSAAATPVELGLDALQAAATSAHVFVESYQDLLANHQQAIRDLVAARRHNEELHGRGQPNWETVRAFVDFAQHRYDVCQGRLRQAIQREANAAQENEKLRIEMQRFGDLRARHAFVTRLVKVFTVQCTVAARAEEQPELVTLNAVPYLDRTQGAWYLVNPFRHRLSSGSLDRPPMSC
jgi:hypothetical protein